MYQDDIVRLIMGLVEDWQLATGERNQVVTRESRRQSYKY